MNESTIYLSIVLIIFMLYFTTNKIFSTKTTPKVKFIKDLIFINIAVLILYCIGNLSLFFIEYVGYLSSDPISILEFMSKPIFLLILALFLSTLRIISYLKYKKGLTSEKGETK